MGIHRKPSILLALLCAGALLVACSKSDPGTATGGADTISDEDTDDEVGPSPDAGGDDDDAGGGATCDDPDGDGFGPGCSAGDDCLPNDASGHPGATERCGDGIDNDCDGVAEEDCPCQDGATRACYSGSSGTQSRGICRGGFSTCADGEWGPCIDEITPQEEICDTIDNDCDGEIDEGLTNACGGCGEVPAETCGDGLDNDCDGQIDDPDAGCDCDERTNQPCYGGPPATLGQGVCRGGFMDCIDGAWGACRGQITPSEEICDGIDNDCDGLVDEGVRNRCGDCIGDEEPVEVCDGIDNDCDGLVDEGLRLACGLCPGDESDEECGDGIDNDCDGLVDEGCSCALGDESCYPGPVDARGVGACEVGSRSCDSTGEFWSECTGYVLPSLEVCDGIDNDCDGEVDIGPDGCSVCGAAVEVCDGIDNDCDGQIDEFVRDACGNCIEDVVPEEDQGQAACDGVDNDCDGLVDEGLLNACGTCEQSCYLETWGSSPDGWSTGDLEGIDADERGLQLATVSFTFPYLWVANSAENTVTKINTDTAEVDGTYSVGLVPSRTAVDFEGNVFVANRAFGAQGTLTKILAEDCSGADCVAFTVNIGGINSIPRGLAIDADGFVWVGTYTDGILWKVHPESGEILASFETGLQIYGLAIDSEELIWISSRDRTGHLGVFSTTENRMIGSWVPPDCSSPYGIAVDGSGNIWMGNWTCNTLLRFDRATFEAGGARFDRFTHAALELARGVAVDGEGFIWVTATRTNRLLKFDPRTNTFVGSWATCESPIGVGVARDGNIWTMCFGSNQAQRFSPTGAPLGNLPVGRNPYSYSDMTGFQLRNFTARVGSWRVEFDCGYELCRFDQVVWSGTEPAGTNISVRARTRASVGEWSDWSLRLDESPAAIFGLPRGRFCEVEVQLSTEDRDFSPTVTDVQLFWQRP